MPSDFTLQVIRKSDGAVVHSWEPGSRVETDLVESVIQQLKGTRVGLFTSTAQVEQRVRLAWGEVLQLLKAQVRPTKHHG